jgi:lipoprotein-anchoring transpeptidase ErfK/SrfK
MRSRFRLLAAAIAAAGLSLGGTIASPARAELLIEIDKTTQRMTVTRDGAQLYVWPVSTGRPGHDTPSGAYKPFRMEIDHYSEEWDNAPMPHSVFFTKRGHAIHGSYEVKKLGTAASAGCVRLEPKNAETLFRMVKAEGGARRTT